MAALACTPQCGPMQHSSSTGTSHLTTLPRCLDLPYHLSPPDPISRPHHVTPPAAAHSRSCKELAGAAAGHLSHHLSLGRTSPPPPTHAHSSPPHGHPQLGHSLLSWPARTPLLHPHPVQAHNSPSHTLSLRGAAEPAADMQLLLDQPGQHNSGPRLCWLHHTTQRLAY